MDVTLKNNIRNDRRNTTSIKTIIIGDIIVFKLGLIVDFMIVKIEEI